jgi:hypothetical protein
MPAATLRNALPLLSFLACAQRLRASGLPAVRLACRHSRLALKKTEISHGEHGGMNVYAAYVKCEV